MKILIPAKFVECVFDEKKWASWLRDACMLLDPSYQSHLYFVRDRFTVKTDQEVRDYFAEETA